MIRTFTRLKRVLCLTLCLISFCGPFFPSFGASHFVKSKSFKSGDAVVSLANLTLLYGTLFGSPSEDPVSSAKTYYWVPFGTNNRGSGAWSDLNHWATSSGGTEKHTTLPSPNDNVVFDLKSFSFSGQTVVVDVEAQVKNISWVNIRPTTFEISNATLQVYGAFQVNSNLILSSAGNFSVEFKSSDLDTPINLLSKSLPKNTTIDFNGTGSWTLQSNLITGTGSSITLTSGSLKTNGFSLSANSFKSIGEQARSLELGTSSVSGLSTWEVSPSLKLSASEAAIVLNGPEAHIFKGGNQTYKSVALHGPESYIYDSNTFNEVLLPTNTELQESNNLILESDKIQTIEILSTSSTEPYTSISSSVKGTNATINFTCVRLCTDYLLLSDISATGTGTFFAGANAKRVGNTSGWNFTSCASEVYAPKTAEELSNCQVTTSIISTGENKWQEIRYNYELIGAIHDGGNALGKVTINFTIDSTQARLVKGANGSDIKLTPRNWSVKTDSLINVGKPVSIKFFGLQSELLNNPVADPSSLTFDDLVLTNYSATDSSENCTFLDNNTKYGTTALISSASFYKVGNYFSAELDGLTKLGEFYLHNGSSAIDFVASLPIKEEPVATTEEMDFTAHWNAKTVKLKWTAPGKTTASYDVERASSPQNKEFQTIISKAPRQNSTNAAVAVYHAEDFSPAAGPANYYRLKRTNADGTITYSQTLKVDNKAYSAAVQASPNPFTDKVKLTVNAEKAGEMNVKLMTEQGNVALEKKIKVAKGTSESELVIGTKVKPGIYLLVTELNGERLTQRLIKQ